MKFNLSRDELLPGLQVVNSVVERRHTLPALSNLLVSTGPKGITLTGTDMEVELISTINHAFRDEREFTVPARKLLDICRTLPEASVLEFTVEKDQVIIRSGKSRFTLATLPAKDFPSTETSEPVIEFEIAQADLKSLIEDTMFAMAQQDVRYYLNGLLLEVGEHILKAVATDGHRLALKEIQQETDAKDQKQVIVPRKGVMELARLLGDTEDKVRVQISKNHIRMKINSIQFTSKLIDGRFPDYERVVPQLSNNSLKANRAALRQSLIRASILSNEKYKGVRIVLKKDSLKAFAHNPEQEEAEEELEVEYSGDEMEIGFNVTYLLDAINAIKTDKVIMATTSPDSSCLLLPEGKNNCKYVVMPMRL
jgi:DNA polymerase-3 subunit beta